MTVIVGKTESVAPGRVKAGAPRRPCLHPARCHGLPKNTMPCHLDRRERPLSPFLLRERKPPSKRNSTVERVKYFSNGYEEDPDGTDTDYDYGALWNKITVTKGGTSQSSEKTMNALGETIQSKDNMGNIVYTCYNPDGTVNATYTSVNPSDSITFEYDVMGNRTSISDPDAGTVLTLYDGFGNLLRQINAKNDTSTFVYDRLGRTIQSTDSRGSLNYVYINDSTDAAYGQIDSIYNSGGSLSERYVYDDTYGRLTSVTRRIPGRTFTDSYAYDWFGRPVSRTYPSGFEVQYTYNDNSDLQTIRGNGTTLWSCNDVNEMGQITSYSQGNYNTSVSYDNYGKLNSIVTGTVMDMRYTWDNAGNLESREDYLSSQKEVFSYDNLNRLTKIEYYLNNNYVSSADLEMTYDNGGNITSKTDAGETINYGEFGEGPHTLTSIINVADDYDQPPQNITYTCFNKVESIQDTIGVDTTLTLDFIYGLNNQRVKTTLKRNSTVERVKYFSNGYEEDSTSSGIKKYHYISAPNGLTAIFVKQGTGNDSMYHVLTDHLGSLTGSQVKCLMVFFRPLLPYFFLFILLNWLLIFRGKKYESLIEKYDYKKGKLYLIYFLATIGIFILPIIIGKWIL